MVCGNYEWRPGRHERFGQGNAKGIPGQAPPSRFDQFGYGMGTGPAGVGVRKTSGNRGILPRRDSSLAGGHEWRVTTTVP